MRHSRVVIGKSILILCALLALSGLVVSCPSPTSQGPEPISVTGVALDHTALSITAGMTARLIATVTPVDADNKDVTWSSDDETVATVSASGLVTVQDDAIDGETATITGTTDDGGLTATCLVTIQYVGVASIAVTPETASVGAGLTRQLNALVLPLDATNPAIVWSSSDEDVATVSDTGLVTVSADATSGQTATITATSVENAGISDTCGVTVVVAVTGVALNKPSTTIAVGAAEQLSATVAPAGATDKSLTWETSDSSIASVSTSGLVSGVAPGNATITARTVDGGFSATCAVTVPVPVTGVSLNITSIEALPGKTARTTQLTATVSPSNAANKAVSWTTSDSAVATVSGSGLVTVQANRVDGQTATITATTADGGFAATCVVTVTHFPLHRTFNSIDIENETLYALPATRRAVGTRAVVYVEDTRLNDISEAAAQAICAEFDANIHDMMNTNFGIETDIDGNGRTLLLLQDILDGYDGSGGYVAGFFAPMNEESADEVEYSNEAEMLYMDVDPAVPGSSSFYETVAHEFQHLINFSNTDYIDEPQDVWINEGLSSGAEYLYAGEQVQDRIDYFNAEGGTIPYGNNFFVWNGYWEQTYGDVLADYSTVYLFFQWLQLHASNGTGIYREILTSSYRDYQCVTTAASSRIDASFSSWEVLMRTWQIANLVCLSTGYYGYLDQITVAAQGFNSTGGASIPFAPGEGLFSATSGGTYTPPAGSGANIRYAGISSTGAVDTTSPYAGAVALCFNANSDWQDPDETGFIADVGTVARAIPAFNTVSRKAPDLSSYPVDVAVGHDGKLSKDSHKPVRGKKALRPFGLKTPGAKK